MSNKKTSHVLKWAGLFEPMRATFADMLSRPLSPVAVHRPSPQSAIAELKSLNPFCKVDVWPHAATAEAVAEHGSDVLGTKKPFTSIVVTRLLPKSQLFALNEYARSNGITFNMAITNGVTASVFSDFGPEHLITDADGEPTKTLALMGIEVRGLVVLLLLVGVQGVPLWAFLRDARISVCLPLNACLQLRVPPAGVLGVPTPNQPPNQLHHTHTHTHTHATHDTHTRTSRPC